MPSSFYLWAVNAVSSTSYLKKVNIPDRAKYSGNKLLTKLKKLPDNSSQGKSISIKLDKRS